MLRQEKIIFAEKYGGLEDGEEYFGMAIIQMLKTSLLKLRVLSASLDLKSGYVW